MSKPISNNEFDSLDAFFGDKLKAASMPPSEKIWQQIEGSLNRDRKRKRGFLWIFYSGVFLIGTIITSYFMFFDNSNSNVSSSNGKKTIAVNQATTNSSPVKKEPITETKISESKNTIENTSKEEKNRLVKIQIGAFKKQKDKKTFSKLNLDIKSEVIANGITRYYAEVPEDDVQKKLTQIHQAGFTDAFIKNHINLLESNTNKLTKHQTQTIAAKNIMPTDIAAKEPVSLIVKNNNIKTNVEYAKQNETSPSNLVVANVNKLEPKELTEKETISENKTNNAVSSETNKSKQSSAGDSDIVAKTDVEIAPTTATLTAKDSSINSIVQKDTPVQEVTVAKKDSAYTKPDSVKNVKPVASVDSLNNPPILNRWALLLTGGPNFLMKNTTSNLFATLGEKQPNTYSATLKVEFKPFKRFAFTAGVSYSYFIAQQDATAFSFNKNLTSDYIFYSSYGAMPVDKNTMLQGYSPAPWVTTLSANYSYTSRINTLLIPIQAKYYYLNTKRINLFADMGISGMMVLSQQTNLSVIKENLTNNILYNQITTNKFNGLLMLGLGGDVLLYKQLYFTIDAGFRYAITNLSNTSGIKTNPTYFSANGGIKIKL